MEDLYGVKIYNYVIVLDIFDNMCKKFYNNYDNNLII